MNTCCIIVNSNDTDASKATVYARHLSSSIIAGTAFLFLLSLSAVLAALSISSAAIAVCLIGSINPYLLIPPMPYWCGAVFAFGLIALTFASAVGCKGLVIFARRSLGVRALKSTQLTEEHLSLIASYPEFPVKKVSRKKVFLVSMAVFAVYFISAFTVSSITAETMGFWHQWNWFVG